MDEKYINNLACKAVKKCDLVDVNSRLEELNVNELRLFLAHMGNCINAFLVDKLVLTRGLEALKIIKRQLNLYDKVHLSKHVIVKIVYEGRNKHDSEYPCYVHCKLYYKNILYYNESFLFRRDGLVTGNSGHYSFNRRWNRFANIVCLFLNIFGGKTISFNNQNENFKNKAIKQTKEELYHIICSSLLPSFYNVNPITFKGRFNFNIRYDLDKDVKRHKITLAYNVKFGGTKQVINTVRNRFKVKDFYIAVFLRLPYDELKQNEQPAMYNAFWDLLIEDAKYFKQ